MLIKELKTIPAVPEKQREVTVGVICDACRMKGTNKYNAPFGSTYETGNVNKVTIQYEYGHSYPDGHSTKLEQFHICPDCWRTMVVPLFEMQKFGPLTLTTEDDY